MKRTRGVWRLVLPTDDVMREFEASELLLKRIDLTLPVLADYVLDQWAQCEQHWGHPGNPAELSTYELILNYLYSDFMTGADMRSIERVDREALSTVIQTFCRAFYQTVIPLLEEFQFTEHQMSKLHSDKWAGRSMVIVIPY